MTRGNIIRKVIERVDQDITFLLNKVKNKIEEQQLNIPYSEEKVKYNIIVQFWRAIIRKAKGKLIDECKLENQRQYVEGIVNIELDEMEQ